MPQTPNLGLKTINRAQEGSTKLVTDWIDDINDSERSNAVIIDTAIGNLQDDLSNVNKSVGELKDELSNIDETVNDLQTNLSTVTETVNELHEDLTAVEESVDNLQEDISSVKETMGDFYVDLSTKAPINSPAFTGTPTVPTLNPEGSLDQIVNLQALNKAMENIDIPDVSDQIENHDTSSSAHDDIRTALNEKAPKNHSSSEATYGIADKNIYGHVKLSDELPLAHGTPSAGTFNGTVANRDHIHPAQTSVSGNAGTATKLESPVNINGVSFDGSEDITISDDTKLSPENIIAGESISIHKNKNDITVSVSEEYRGVIKSIQSGIVTFTVNNFSNPIDISEINEKKAVPILQGMSGYHTIGSTVGTSFQIAPYVSHITNQKLTIINSYSTATVATPFSWRIIEFY